VQKKISSKCARNIQQQATGDSVCFTLACGASPLCARRKPNRTSLQIRNGNGSEFPSGRDAMVSHPVELAGVLESVGSNH
jgi:hypothetical protein